jgi:hypothetical protein
MTETPHMPAAGAVLDIGGDVGALIITTGPQLEEAELEVCRVAKPHLRTHSQVHPRPVGDRISYAALFPSLTAGAYRLLAHPGAPPTSQDRLVMIHGGQVSRISLSDEGTRDGLPIPQRINAGWRPGEADTSVGGKAAK